MSEYWNSHWEARLFRLRSLRSPDSRSSVWVCRSAIRVGVPILVASPGASSGPTGGCRYSPASPFL